MASRALGTVIAAAIGAHAAPAMASEGGSSFYLLGSGGPEAAVLPPLQGVYMDDTTYIYGGSASGEKDFVLGGNVVAGLDATIIANFPSLLWAPAANPAGVTFGIGAALPVGAPMVDVSAVLTGPGGGQLDVERKDSALIVADPVLTAVAGMQSGDWHFALTGTVNVPIGNYREGELANLAFHRWIEDLSFATTWHDDKSGWDVSGKFGFTFNGTNDATDYKSGTDFHLEGSVEKTFSKSVSGGLQGYYYDQISGDSGSGAVLGPNEGKVAALGGTLAYHAPIGKMPATWRARLFEEFDATRRLKGTAFYFSLTVPLAMKLPAAPPAQ